MNLSSKASFRAFPILFLACGISFAALAQTEAGSSFPTASSRRAGNQPAPPPASANYRAVQQRLAQGWNTWDTNSVLTQVLLPEGLAIHVGMKHNATLGGDAFLGDVLIGRLQPGAEQVVPGPHAWDGSYTDLRVTWKGHSWRIQSAHDAGNLVLLATPLPSKPISALPPTLVVSVNFLWNRPGTALRRADFIETRGASGTVPVYCTCNPPSAHAESDDYADVPVACALLFSRISRRRSASIRDDAAPWPRLRPSSIANARPMNSPSSPPVLRRRFSMPLKPRSAGTPSTSRTCAASSPR